MMKAKNIHTAAAIAALLFLVAGCSALDTAGFQKEKWMYTDLVDAEFVKAHQSIPMDENVMLIDARPYKPKYVKGHIPHAVSIPYSKFEDKTNLLPENKEALLIFYCGGLSCRLSHKSARKAEELGYTNVKVFAKGFPEWKKQKNEYISVSAEYVSRAIEENRALIVDSRPKKPKFDKGHIPSSISLPFSRFDELNGKLPRDKNTPLIFYCGGLKCRLSHKSAMAAMELGYTDVSVFSKGYPAWKSEYGSAGTAIEVKAGEIEGSIDLDRFRKIIKEDPESVMLIDTRDPDEFKKGSLETSVNMTIEELEKKVDELPSDKPVVFVCSTGARSGEAYYMVRDLRPSLDNVYYVEAQITFHKDGSCDIKENE
ncbi:MAG: rhodanese-like domain-containing protein [Desulfobacteraceae bacterium]